MNIRFALVGLLMCSLIITGIFGPKDRPVSEPAAATLSSAQPLSDSPLLESPPFSINCASALLMEPESGQIIFELNADAQRPVASVTKMMTILLTLEAIDAERICLDDTVAISPNASGMGGSQVLLDTGEIQTVSVLLKSMIVGSANDAAVALAEALYGSEEICVNKMNDRAAALGMTNTHFENCTGLPVQGQHTTARDIARMSAEVFSHPLYYEYSKIWLDEVDHGDGRVTQLTNTNKLIRLYDGCDGGKTGSTNEAGYCISATAQRGGMRLIAVVLGANSGSDRFDIAREMLDFGFANYRLYPVAQRGTKVRGALPITGGEIDALQLALDGDLTLLILKGDEQNIQLSPNLPESLAAPIQAGDVVGSVDVIVEGRSVASIPVVACDSIDSVGFSRNIERFWQNWIYTY